MNELRKSKVHYRYIPEGLASQFEGILDDHYYGNLIHDVQTLASMTDNFILQRDSFLKTGVPFNDEVRDAILYGIGGGLALKIQEMPLLISDIHLYLNHYHMFYADNFCEIDREYIGIHNMYCKEVW